MLRGEREPIKPACLAYYRSGESAERRERTDKAGVPCLFIGLERKLRGERGRIRCDDLYFYWFGEGAERRERTDKMRCLTFLLVWGGY